MVSKYVSAERLTNDEVNNQHRIIKSQAYFEELFNAVNSVACILNDQRQIVFANKNFLELIEVSSIEELLGIRPGEAIACKHAFKEKGGCGTSENCTVCGVVKSILKCQDTRSPVQEEARLVTHGIDEDKSWDVMTYARPIQLDGKYYTVLSIEDISAIKRKENLEKVFFHDIHNVAGGLNGLMSLVQQMPDKNDARDMINISLNLSHELVDEIKHFRHFSLAELGQLDVTLSKFPVLRVLQEVMQKVKFHKVAKDKNIVLQEIKDAETIETDKILLHRVLVNMLKNALEATPKNGIVSLSAKLLYGQQSIRFWVNNQYEMPKNIKLQVFQRSFSTKGSNRGLGTYSIKLFTERYLRGKAGFISNQEVGTTFYVDLPVSWQ